MKGTLYNLGKYILIPFPRTKIFLKQLYRILRSRYLKVCHQKGAFMICNGAEIFCDFNNESYSWYDGDSESLNYELEVFTSLFTIRTPNVILDVGAHWGFYSAFLNNTSFSNKIAKIISIEADPFNCSILSKTLKKINHIHVEQINAAISDKDGFIHLYLGDGKCKQTYSSGNTIPVGQIKAISLDSLVENFLDNEEVLTHVKMDIDGYEPAFFAGGETALKKFSPIIMMEFWAKGLKVSGFDLEAYWNMLQNNYYVKEACFSNRRLISLDHKDLPYLVEKTMEGITNLVLIPKVYLKRG